MAKVIIYHHSDVQKDSRKAGSDGVDFTQAWGMDDLSRSLRTKDSVDMVILDSVPSGKQPEITKQIKQIKDIPVLFFEDASVQTRKSVDRATGTMTAVRKPAKIYIEAPETGKAQKHEPLEDARQYLDDNFKQQLTLAQIAAVADISPSYFCRKFKSKYGLSPITYLRNLRIDRACHLLEHTNLPLAQITDQSGFFSIPYFCREFRKVKGISPIQYRRQNAQSKD